MRKKHFTARKLWTLLLSCGLLSSLGMPLIVQAEADNSAAGNIKNGDVILLGEADDAIGFNGQWIVLDAAHTNTGEDGMFLLSQSVIGSDLENGMLFRDIGDDIVVTFDDRGDSYAAEHPDVLNYQDSDIRQWCTDFLGSHFSKAEQDALLETYKSDDDYHQPVTFAGKNTTVDFDAAENNLNGDKLFLLSAEEAANPNYGFTDDESRLTSLDGKGAMWWLRSPHSPTYPLDVGIVFPTGAIMDFPVNAQTGYSVKFLTCARPACNLDITRVSEAKATGKAEDGATIWSLTLTEDSDGTPAETQTPEKGNPAFIIGGIGIGALILALLILFFVKRRSK